VTRRPRLLDLFCGEGGAGRGYHDAGFEMVGVDTSAARLAHYPYECHQADALAFLAEHGHEFDAVHASPPCTGYSRGTSALPDRLTRYDRLIAATRSVLSHPEVLRPGTPWVIENVEDAGRELRTPLTLCWTHFRRPGSVSDDDGTPLWMRRHRLFESNLWLTPADQCAHPASMQCAGAYGGARRDKIEARTIRHGGYVPSARVMRLLLGTPWMTEEGCRLSIPPVYAEHLGAQLVDHLATSTTAAAGAR
jgi:DNA (cytosine-5)-methyltransferase 1